MSIELIHGDCMDVMATYPDKYFDLAIVDPPYGIDISVERFKRGQSCKKNGFKEHLNKDWDKEVPNDKYFKELFRVSRNQIIWGGNYFDLPPSRCFLIWDKVQRIDQADCEIAWTSFNTSARIFAYARGNESGFAPKLQNQDRAGINIHPTQKPIALYKWLLINYANEGDKILDTHLGSGSSAIAAHKLGFDFVGIEIDKDYYDAAVKRFNLVTSQLSISL